VDASVDIRRAAELANTILRLRRSLSQLATRGGPDPDLQLAKSEVLRLVFNQPGVRVQDVADGLGIAPNTASTLVTQLAQLGLVERGRDPDDARVVLLFPTAAARARRARIRGRRDSVIAEALSALSAGDRAAVLRAVQPLGRLLRILDQSGGRN